MEEDLVEAEEERAKGLEDQITALVQIVVIRHNILEELLVFPLDVLSVEQL